MPKSPARNAKKAPAKKASSRKTVAHKSSKKVVYEYTIVHVIAALVIGTVMGLIGAPMFFASLG